MRAFVFTVLVAVAGCAPAANEPTPRTAAAAPSPSSQPAPVASSAPVPQSAAAPAPEAARRAPRELLTEDGVNYACSVPADCAVKDVGNCCGYYPACVAKDSPTFPERVKAQCAKDGMSSICGFPEISGCDCIEGRCTALPGARGAGGDIK